MWFSVVCTLIDNEYASLQRLWTHVLLSLSIRVQSTLLNHIGYGPVEDDKCTFCHSEAEKACYTSFGNVK